MHKAGCHIHMHRLSLRAICKDGILLSGCRGDKPSLDVQCCCCIVWFIIGLKHVFPLLPLLLLQNDVPASSFVNISKPSKDLRGLFMQLCLFHIFPDRWRGLFFFLSEREKEELKVESSRSCALFFIPLKWVWWHCLQFWEKRGTVKKVFRGLSSDLSRQVKWSVR